MTTLRSSSATLASVRRTVELPVWRRYGRPHVAMVLVIAASLLAFMDLTVGGFRMSGWAWLSILGVAAPIVLIDPLSPRAARLLLPYLAYMTYAVVTMTWTLDLVEAVFTLAQMAVVVFAYLLAWRISNTQAMQRALRVVALSGIGFALLLTLLTLAGRRTLGPIALSIRPMAIGLIALFALYGLRAASWRAATLVGATTLGIMLYTGSRAAGAALIIVLLTNPALTENRPRWFVAVALALAAALALSSTAAFKERFFFSADASLRDVVTVSDRLNTAGRRELWPKLVDECGEVELTGSGLGSATQLSRRLTNGTLDHPHNEYLRIWCDLGWIGTVLFWGFFAAAITRNVRGLRSGRNRTLHIAALQLLAVLLILSVTDNPLLYTALFMAPLAAVLGLADSASTTRLVGGQPTIGGTDTSSSWDYLTVRSGGGTDPPTLSPSAALQRKIGPRTALHACDPVDRESSRADWPC